MSRLKYDGIVCNLLTLAFLQNVKLVPGLGNRFCPDERIEFGRIEKRVFSLLGFRPFGVVGSIMKQLPCERFADIDRQLVDLRKAIDDAGSKNRQAREKESNSKREVEYAKTSLEKIKRVPGRLNAEAYHLAFKSAEKEYKERMERYLNAIEEGNRAQQQLKDAKDAYEEKKREREHLERSLKDSADWARSLHKKSLLCSPSFWKCIESRIRLFNAEGSVPRVYDPIALIGNVGIGKEEAVQCAVRGMYAAGAISGFHCTVLNGSFAQYDLRKLLNVAEERSCGAIVFNLENYVSVSEAEDRCKYDENRRSLRALRDIVLEVRKTQPRLLLFFICVPRSVEEVLSALDDASGAFIRQGSRCVCDDPTAETLLTMLEQSNKDGRVCLRLSFSGGAREFIKYGIKRIREIEGGSFANRCSMDRLRDDLIDMALECNGGKKDGESYLITESVVQKVLSSEDWRVLSTEDADRDRIRGEAMAELSSLVGMASVKNAIEAMETDLQFDAELARANGDDGRSVRKAKPSFAFIGPAGTGKTTVAKLMARLLYGIGVCEENNLVVVSPSDLVAGYLGQSGPQTRRKIQEARGGVLFIDEAYNLKISDPGGKDSNDFQGAVIQELLTAMTDPQSDVVFIFAGYEKEMNRFFDSNEGIRSRIKETIRFEPYGPDDLARIVTDMLGERGLSVDRSARALLIRLMAHVSTLGEQYANARGAEKIADEIKREKSLQWREGGSGARLDEIDSRVLESVMLQHGLEPGAQVGSEEAEDCSASLSSDVDGGGHLGQIDGRFNTLRNWLSAYEREGMSIEGLNPSGGPARINKVLERMGYVTASPNRRFTQKAKDALGVMEEERQRNDESYVALLYSQAAFDIVLRMYRAHVSS